MNRIRRRLRTSTDEELIFRFRLRNIKSFHFHIIRLYFSNLPYSVFLEIYNYIKPTQDRIFKLDAWEIEREDRLANQYKSRALARLYKFWFCGC